MTQPVRTRRIQVLGVVRAAAWVSVGAVSLGYTEVPDLRMNAGNFVIFFIWGLVLAGATAIVRVILLRILQTVRKS